MPHPINNQNSKKKNSTSPLEKDLIVSEIRYRRLFESAKDGILILDAETGTILDVNPFLVNLLGYSKENLMQKEVWEIGFLKDIVQSKENFLELQQNEYIRYDNLPLETADGRIINVEFVSNVYLEGRQKVIQCNIRDITERKELETNLLAATEIAKLGYWEFDVKAGNFIFNDQYYRIIHGSSTDKQGGNIMSAEEFIRRLIHPDDSKMIGKNMQEALSSPDPEYFGQTEAKVLCENGEIKNVMVRFMAIKDQLGSTHTVYGISQDITERKRIEESLVLFRTLLDKSNDAIEVIDMETAQFIDVNERVCTELGYSRSELLSMKVFDINPDQTPEAFRSLMVESQQSASSIFETLRQRKDGSTFPVEANVTIVKLEKMYAIAIVRDITERKRSTEALKMAKEYAENLIETANTILVGLDAGGNIMVFNKAAEEITGYSRSELKGQNWFETLVPKNDYPQLWKEFERLSVFEFPKEFENKIITKSGEERYIVWQNNQIIEKGNFVGTISFGIDITERRKSEEALRESRQILEGIINTIPVSVFWKDRNLVYLGCNKIFAHDAGYNDPAEIIGKDDSQMSWCDQAELYRNDDLFTIENEKSKLLIEEPQTTPEGKTKTLLTSKMPLRSSNGEVIGILGTYIDITERKHAEEEILMLAHALKGVNECVSITDLEDNIMFVNESFLKTYGYLKNELIGKNIKIVGSQKNESKFVEKILPDTSKGGWEGELWNKRKDGSEFLIDLSTTIIKDTNGKPLGLIGVASDITEKKYFELELIRAKEKAEESDRLKSAFLANMSHEIRTPMNGILGFAGLLQEPDLTGEEQQEYIKIIEKSGARMLNIISEIVDISRIESGQMEVNYKETNINKLIENIFNLLKLDAEDKRINLSLKNSVPPKETIIKTDSEKLYSILTNLVKNAIKYTDNGSIEFGFKNLGNYLEFYVKDTGIGIPSEKLEAIFERFIQADIADIEARQGAGLGLSIAKAFVELLKGKIWVESEQGKGSIFYFTIPIDHEPEETDTSRQVVPPEGAMPKIDDLKILIIEDDETSARLISIMINEFGKEIINAKTGSEAVEICRINHDIDLILMDIQMPDMNGFEATRQIRQFNKDVIIIAQTAFGLVGDRRKAIEAGCNDYISKPIGKDELLTLIQMYFKK